MVICTVEVNEKAPQTIVIGRRGTYNTQEVVFDIDYLIDAYGVGTAVLAVKRSQDSSAYPAVVAQEDSTVTWTVSETDTYYKGAGECELMWYVDGGLAKTIIYPMVVMRDILSTTEEAPDAYQTWVDDLTALGAETLQNAQDAAQSASDAEESAERAETAIAHAPIIQDGYWYIWNDGEYINTNIRAEGQKGDTGDKGNTVAGVFLYQRTASVPESGPDGDVLYDFETGEVYVPNLLPEYGVHDSETVEGLTFTWNEDNTAISVSGKRTGQYGNLDYSKILFGDPSQQTLQPPLEAGKSYLFGFHVSPPSADLRLRVNINTTTGESTATFIDEDTVITLPDNCKTARLSLVVAARVTHNNVVTPYLRPAVSLRGWNDAMPTTDGNPCWVTQAIANGSGTTAIIPEGSWSTPVKMVKDGITPDFAIGTVQTLQPDQPATATITGTPENPVLNLGIPKGEKGEGGGAVESVNGQTGVVVLTAADVGAGTYSKPSGGIPKTDLAAAVQTSLGKADTALQTAPVSSVAGKTGAVTLDAGDAAFSDSETYAAGTVGAALSAQKNAISTVETDLSDLEDRVTALDGGDVDLSYEIVENSYVANTNGTIYNYNGWNRTSYINLKDVSKLKINISQSTVYNYYYKADKSPLENGNLQLSAGINEVTIPEGAAYLICSGVAASINAMTVENGDETTEDTNAKIEVYKPGNLIDYNDVTNGYINNTGGVTSVHYLWCTGFCPITGNIIYCYGINPTSYFAFYGEDKNKIATWEDTGALTKLSANSTVYYVSAPANAKYFRGTITSDPTVTKFAWVSEQPETPDLNKEYSVENAFPYNYNPENPCDYTELTVRAFSKVVCIGDSLTYGGFNLSNSGTPTGETQSSEELSVRYSYPSNFERITGVETVNAGDSGETSVSWYQAHQNDDFSSYDLAVIFLGVNDSAFQVSDADTLTAMQNIVTMLNNARSDMRIAICSCIPAYDGAGYQAKGQLILNWAKSLNDPNIIPLDLAQYSHVKPRTSYVAGHCSALGYYMMALDIARYISWYMDQNKRDFRFIQFIGSPDAEWSGD